ncbi:MAG TPA: FAD-dependent monooxygenase [Thermoanaerobaculia bacterium]|nr:FAD-dependent monooxygenase [Thermoanaerobaculia bacterium]
MSTAARPRIAIAGAGVGGLAAALACRRAGAEVTVLEAGGRARAAGGGLGLLPNAAWALRSLGAERQVAARATTIHSYVFLDWNGTPLHRFPVAELTARCGGPMWMIERRDLLAALGEALAEPAGEDDAPADDRSRPPARPRVLYGVACAGFELRPGVVRLRLGADAGPRAVHDLLCDGLIGADGFRSAIRRQLLGDGGIRTTRRLAWTGSFLAPADRWPGQAGEMVTFSGRGLLLTATTMTGRPSDPSGARRVVWFASETLTPAGARPGWLAVAARFAAVEPRIGALLARSDDAVGFELRDRRPVSRWGRGPVTLLGDAAHPCSPDLSQGACQALEDAAVLGAELAHRASVEDAWRRYERVRAPRAARVTRTAWLSTLARTFAGPPLDGLRNLAMSRLVPPFLQQELHFVAGGEPVPWLIPSWLLTGPRRSPAPLIAYR